jgi:hypothetical protein
MILQLQVTDISFDLDSLDLLQQPNLQEHLQEEYVGYIVEIEVPDDADDEDIGNELFKELTAQSGTLIDSLSYTIKKFGRLNSNVTIN